jgi:hypothetical protein
MGAELGTDDALFGGAVDLDDEGDEVTKNAVGRQGPFGMDKAKDTTKDANDEEGVETMSDWEFEMLGSGAGYAQHQMLG